MQEELPERCCARCEHVMWIVALGLGVRCGHASTRVPNVLPPLLPSRHHCCDLFEKRSGRRDADDDGTTRDATRRLFVIFDRILGNSHRAR